MPSLRYHLSILYFRARALPTIWNFINRHARKEYAEHVPNMDHDSIVRDLKKDGIAIRHMDSFPGGQDLLASLEAHVAEMRGKAETRTNKKFLEYLWDPVPVLDMANPFHALAFDPAYVNPIHGYLGLMGRCANVNLAVTLPVGQEPPVQSQRWHRDPADHKITKIFIYLNDVDTATGPFNYVKGSQSGGKWRQFHPQKLPGGSLPPADEVTRTIPLEDIVVATGKKGTIIYCDTTGIHKGGHATAKERIMFTAGYITSAYAWPPELIYDPHIKVPYPFMLSPYYSPLTAFFGKAIKKRQAPKMGMEKM